MGVGIGVGGAAAGGVLAAEVCAPLLLLCWLCCWPDDASDTSSSGKHPKKPTILTSESGSRRRTSDLFGKRFASSAVSLHLPSTSTQHSHEEIQRRQSHDARYHSAPSVIHEVLHRRDWERSTKELYIPLNPEREIEGIAPQATPESFSPEKPDEPPLKPCKKHHSNIKSSKRKEEQFEEDKDRDIESPAQFYIGEETTDKDQLPIEDKAYPAKEDKQSLNESIRLQERPWADQPRPGLPGLTVDELDMDDLAVLEELDRSGAHHVMTSAMGYSRMMPFSPISVEAVGYDYDGSCQLAERGELTSLRSRTLVSAAQFAATRARHASDGDILAPAPRPESGAFSESDLDLDLELALADAESQDLPPDYSQLTRPDHKETAI